MRKIIEKQLEACIWADLTALDKSTGKCFIPRYSKPQYKVQNCYLIKVDKDIVNNTNSLLATNFNNGRAPTHEYFKAYVNKDLGKYIYVDCLAYDFENKHDLTEYWSGWLETSKISQIALL